MFMLVSVNALHNPLLKLYRTIYNPGKLLLKSTSPVLISICKPAVAVKVPPVIPDKVTDAIPKLQKGVPA